MVRAVKAQGGASAKARAARRAAKYNPQQNVKPIGGKEQAFGEDGSDARGGGKEGKKSKGAAGGLKRKKGEKGSAAPERDGPPPGKARKGADGKKAPPAKKEPSKKAAAAAAGAKWISAEVGAVQGSPLA